MTTRPAESEAADDCVHTSEVDKRRAVVRDVRVVVGIPVREHGLVSTYRDHGCRCTACCDSWQAELKRDRAYKDKIKKHRVLVDGVLVAVGVSADRHGLVSTYRNHGCRCGSCRDSIEAIKDRRVLVDGMLTAPVPAEQHGRETTYKNHFCRCALCKEAAQIMAQIRRGG